MTPDAPPPVAQPVPSATHSPHAGLPDWLAARGYGAQAARDLIAFDVAYFQWVRLVMRGEVRDVLMRAMDDPLDPATFHGLTAVARIATGLGRAAPQDPTIGIVAEEMGVDPSRASRIVADLVARGLCERAVVQSDARKTVLRLTPDGITTLHQIRDTKWTMMAAVFEDWTEAEIASFSALFRRYIEGVGRQIARAKTPNAD